MANKLINSAFKIKAGVVATDDGLVPERGAIVFDKSRNSLVSGDGFNWIPIGAAGQTDAVALELETPTPLAITGTPTPPDLFYDTIIYQIGTTIVPTLGTTVTFGADGIVDVSNDWKISAGGIGTTVTIHTFVNGIETHSRTINFPFTGGTVQAAWINSEQVTNGDVVTIGLSTNNPQSITLEMIDVGLHYK